VLENHFRRRKKLVRVGALVFLGVLAIGLPYEIHRYSVETRTLSRQAVISFPGLIGRRSPRVLLGPGGLIASHAFGSGVAIERSFTSECSSNNRQGTEVAASFVFVDSAVGPRAVAIVYCRTLTGDIGSLLTVYRPLGSTVVEVPSSGFLPGEWQARVTKQEVTMVPTGVRSSYARQKVVRF
jgi:hypothetical protein